jgi:two-component system, OmpR family, alkaline phosphatase synthesis response regulator PhoP
MKILIVDDERNIVSGLRRYFEQAGFTVSAAFDGPSGLSAYKQEEPDLVILDLMLPGMDGWDVCRNIRRDSDVPIIMLTARVEETDKLIGLELGADDYVTKPFSPRELVGRARAVLRRTKSIPRIDQQIYEFGDVIFDTGARNCTIEGRVISLTPIEYEVLFCLVTHPRLVLSRNQLLEMANLGAYEGVERTVDVHIHNLRKKIEKDPANPRHIITAFGAGYRFDPN